MDPEPAVDEAATLAERRQVMRDQAVSRSQSGHLSRTYETPEWLSRSFVLPLQPPVAEVPVQSIRTHDDAAQGAPQADLPNATSRDEGVMDDEPAPASIPDRSNSFVRPSSPPIDFARVVRRSDLTRHSVRVAWFSASLAGAALIAWLLTSALAFAVLAVGSAVVMAVSFAVRSRMTSAPVPRIRS